MAGHGGLSGETTRVEAVLPGGTGDLARAEAAESELRRLGLTGIRVHHHEGTARLVVPEAEIPSVCAHPLRGEVYDAVRSAGFGVVVLDLAPPSALG